MFCVIIALHRALKRWRASQTTATDTENQKWGNAYSLGHGECARSGVLELEILVGELLAVDGLASGAVAVGEVAALDHEVLDDAVKLRALVAEPLLAGGERPKVLGLSLIHI